MGLQTVVVGCNPQVAAEGSTLGLEGNVPHMKALIRPCKAKANLAEFDSLVGDARRQKTPDHAQSRMGLCEIRRSFGFKLGSRTKMHFVFILVRIREGSQDWPGVQVGAHGQPGFA